MEARMRSLEDALAIIQISESDQPHPLLSSREELEDDEGPMLQALIDEQSISSSPVLPQASGTLWTDERGSSRFFGPSGGAEVSICGLLLDFCCSDFQCSKESFDRKYDIQVLCSPLIAIVSLRMHHLPGDPDQFSRNSTHLIFHRR